jgi:hypothetical protein
MFIITSLFRLIVLVLSDLSMLPALALMKRNHRHFPLFIAIFQFTSKSLYNLCDALQINFFISKGDWLIKTA